MECFEGIGFRGTGGETNERKCLCPVYRCVGMANAFGESNSFKPEITSCKIKEKCKIISHRATVSTSLLLFPVLDTATHYANFQSFSSYRHCAES